MRCLSLLCKFSLSIMLTFLQRGGESGVNNSTANVARAMAYGFPVLSLMFTAWLPSALTLSFLTAGIFSYFQATVLRNPSFRSFLGVYPLPPSLPNPFEAPPDSPFRKDIVTVKKDSTTGTYEAPRGDGGKPWSVPDAKSTLLGGLRKELTSSVSTMKESGKSVMENAKAIAGESRKDGKRTKRELEEANKYEKKRQLEEAQASLKRDRERKLKKAKAKR